MASDSPGLGAFEYRVRATDAFGNVGAWSAGGPAVLVGDAGSGTTSDGGAEAPSERRLSVGCDCRSGPDVLEAFAALAAVALGLRRRQLVSLRAADREEAMPSVRGRR